jgi:phosphohistidine phosphatase SixA
MKEPEITLAMERPARYANRATCRYWLVSAGVVGAALLLSGVTHGQTAAAEALVPLLRKGGYVLVMRHASSPREAPDKQTANADNVKLERQLDEAGRTGSSAMGKALRDLKIPIGEVLSSPTYRALETVRFAQVPNPQARTELGDGGQSMQSVSDAQGVWLRERAKRLPNGTNIILVTHMPNIARAFPDWGAVADGEVVVVGADGKGGTRAIGRITIDEWSRLR